MAGKDHVLKWSTTAASNTDIANIGIQGTNLVSNFDNAFREDMAEVAGGLITRLVTKGAVSATAALTDHNQFWNCTGTVINLTAAATLTDGWCLWVRANGSGAVIDPNGAELINGAPSVTLTDGQAALIICTGTAFFTVMQGAVGPSAPPGYIFGLTMSNNAGDVTNDLDIAAGSAVSDEISRGLITLASALGKRIDAAWAVGGTPGATLGGMDTGTVADGNTYHVYLIRRPDTGVVDALFSLSATAPTTPANYTQKRRIGSVIYFGTKIQLFTQIGDEFLRTPIRDVNLAGTFGTTAALAALSVPTGIKVGAMIDGSAQKAAAVLFSLITSPDQADSAPGATVNTMTSASGAQGYFSGVWRTDTSAQIRVRCDTAAANLLINTRGWIDTRGRV